MMRNYLIMLGFSLSLSLLSFGQGLVSQPNQRVDLLVGVDSILGRDSTFFPVGQAERSSPFLAVAAEPEAPVVTDQPRREAPVAVAPEPRLSDRAALRMAARSFQPSGSLITSTRRVLRLADGRMVNEGHIFAVAIRGERYRVEIDSVSEDGYVLKVGDATLARSFTETDNRVQRANTAQE